MVSATFDNSSDLGWVVQKFGGTSVGKFPDKVSFDLLLLLLLFHSASRWRQRETC